MDHVIFVNDYFESIPDYRKKVLSLFLFEGDYDLLNECGLKDDVKCIWKSLKNNEKSK